MNIIYNGNSVRHIGDNIINGSTLTETKEFDERKSVDCCNIDQISVKSAVIDISVSSSSSSKAEIHLYGKAATDGNISLDVQAENRELKIKVKQKGNYFDGKLKLDITIPRKLFTAISAKSETADITLKEGVSANSLKVKTETGKVKSDVTFKDASIKTETGGVDLNVNAKNDINVEISTETGNISANLYNVSHISLHAKAELGDVINRHKGCIIGYNAYVNVSSTTGSIEIQ